MLFQYQKFQATSGDAIDSIKAPLCSIRFAALAGDSFESASLKPSYVHALPSRATVTGWQLEQCHFELLLCDLSVKLKDGKQVDGCGAAMWRVRALDQLKPLAFNASLLKVPSDVEIGPESGEGLDAQSWSAGGQTLMLATEDGDVLGQRAKERDWMPFRLQRSLASRFPEYLPDGLTVRVPALDSAELCQVQFVLSWTQTDGLDDSAWLAVDRKPVEILAAAGCS